MKPRIPITTATLYWLIVLCGLVGMTMIRSEHIDQLFPLWVGSVLGVALGQTATLARIRPRVPLFLIPATAWLTLPLGIAFFEGSGMSSVQGQWLALSFFPALVGGYLSLSERGTLAAFWYPAVLWMIVILDHPLDPARTAFHPGTALPFLVLLGALFIAFFRARETRRVAIWQGWGAPRLATDVRRTVLRASPVRGALSVVWTGAIGGVALLLAWWVAPHLWQKEEQLRNEEAVAMHVRPTSTRCCGSARTERIEEYLPLVNNAPSRWDSCVRCEQNTRPASTTDGETGSGSYGSDSYGSGSGSGSGSYGSYNSYPTTGTGTVDPYTTTTTPLAGYAAPPVVQQPSVQPPVVDAPAVPHPYAGGHAKPTVKPHVTTPSASPAADFGTPVYDKPSGYAGYSGYAPIVRESRGFALPASAPWPWLFAAAILGALGHVGLRFVRRGVTLAHLARPFWKESVDQQVSNQWQRMLIGLRDAGIQLGRDETPGAFARRIGIEGMETCATILERVRHGVRVESGDLDAMNAAASSVFARARARAGASGRAAAMLRWPLV